MGIVFGKGKKMMEFYKCWAKLRLYKIDLFYNDEKNIKIKVFKILILF